MEDQDYIKHSAKWLFEEGFVNNDYVKSALVLNIYNASQFITDVEILIDVNNKRMLVYLELSLFGKFLYKKKRIARDVKEILLDALPSWETRTIYEKDLFEKATKIMLPVQTPLEKTPKEVETNKEE
jgi:hypothetical protein